ncbi:MAG: helix-turn-helix domain-containing protein [Anaerovoracaceae bacterium]
MKLNSKKVMILLAEKNMSISDLEKLSGLSHVTVSHAVNGYPNLRPITVNKIAKALAVNIIDILI